MADTINTASLPFSDFKQKAILGYMVGNEKFFKLAHTKIKPTWFLQEEMAKLYYLMVSFFQSTGFCPDLKQLQFSKEVQSLDLGKQIRLIALLTECIAQSQHVKLEVLQEELTEWLHAVVLIEAVREVEKDWNINRNVETGFKKLADAVKEVQEIQFDRGTKMDFLNFRSYLQENETERIDALSTGLSILDKCMLEGVSNGGMQRGDTTIIMSSLNAGKSTFLSTVALHNVLAGKDVFYMSHEGRPDDIRLKFLSGLLGCLVPDIFELGRTADGIKRLDNATKLLDQHLMYVPYNKAGMTVEDVVPVIRANQEEWMANHDGKGFDLLVSDYPALLSSELAKKGTLQKRSIDEVVYDNYVQLALEYEFHSLLAIQTNREGGRVNKRIDGENRILQTEDVQESYAPMQRATNVITINRGPSAEAMDLISYGLVKCRNNKKGLVVIAKSNFAHSVSHSETLGGMGYVGTRCIEDKFEALFPLYKNQMLPPQVARQFGI